MGVREEFTMTDRDAQLLAILKVGHETSMRGSEISLRDALIRSRYRELRESLDPNALIPLIRDNPTLIAEWIAYSEDKRTDGGWYLLENGDIGRVGLAESRIHFDSMEEAVANFVVRELNYWLDLNSGQ
jgi:hypothetical protein